MRPTTRRKSNEGTIIADVVDRHGEDRDPFDERCLVVVRHSVTSDLLKYMRCKNLFATKKTKQNTLEGILLHFQGDCQSDCIRFCIQIQGCQSLLDVFDDIIHVFKLYRKADQAR